MKTTVRESPATLAILAVLVLAGLGLRVGYAVDQPATPPPDAEAYARIAESLYRDGSFDARPEGAAREVQPSSAYSPGLPLFVAGVYEVTGGVHLTLALILLAILGAGAVPMAYLLGCRFAGPVAGLIGAGAFAIYPALLEYQGLLLTEPLAAFLLSAGLVLFFMAAERAQGTGLPWNWLGSGAVFGLLALVRPEYLLLALGLPLVWLAREAWRKRARAALSPVALSLLATALVLAPWTIHNAVELDRFVPISTGGGKALFIGTNLEADGDSVELREILLEERPALRARFEAEGRLDDPDRLVLERVLERVAAASYPDLETDAALGRLGRQNLEDGIGEEPLRFAGMMATKSYETWTDAARGVMLDQPWRALQLAIVVLALAGVAILAWRRRFEALVTGLVLLYMTAIAALLISSPRRELVVLPLLAALAGACLVELGAASAALRADSLGRMKAWIRSLPDRVGRTTLILLVAILALGFGLRAYRVAEPLRTPGDDAAAYYDLSKSLYEEGSYGSPGFRDASDWSPGAPLLYAGSFYATGGAREGTARIVELLCGLAAILVVFQLGRRIACRPAGLIAAFGAAVYPPFIHSTGALFSEPPAIFTLPAAVLAFLWASDQERLRAWLLPGLLFGLTALIRPEYMLVGGAFAVLALIRVGRARGWRPGLAGAALLVAAFLIPIVPWTVRNVVVLDRAVPISTGGGKALYVGTYLPADGEYQRVKALLAERYLGRDLEPGSEALDEVGPAPLFDRVAARYPDMPRDEALGRIGKDNFYDYLEEDPAGYAAMTVRKVWRMWSAGIGEAMGSTIGRVVQVLLVALALAGLGVLAWRRWWWELVALATPIAIVTAVGAASLAAPRRNEILMTLAFPLAGAALARAGGALFSSDSWSSPSQASSPPS